MFYRQITNSLEKWSNRTIRKPLILRGARQVGKTTVVKEFGKRFGQFIYLNLEKLSDQTPFMGSSNIDELVQSIFLYKHQNVSEKNNTLLFIDEIQELPEALNMLRYFYEEYPELRVIAAGSLLETIFNQGLSFPTGRVEFMVIRPVNFAEFLGATGKALALEQLQQIPINDFAHLTLLRLFHTYAITGGMPEIVQEYAATEDFTALSHIYEQLITSYTEDVEKYARNNQQVQVISRCIRLSFRQAGTRIKFQHFGNSNYSSKEVGEALRILEKTFLLCLIYPTINATLPVETDYKRSPRLQVLDTGIMNYTLGIQKEIIGTEDLNKIHTGTIIEHLVGQEMLSNQFNVLSSLNFWTREKVSSTAEVDYIYPFESQLIPIEVKSGKDGALKSLHLFMDEAPHDIAIRFYNGKLQLTNPVTPSGKTYRLLSLPYYLASYTKEYIAWLKSGAARPSPPPPPKAPPL